MRQKRPALGAVILSLVLCTASPLAAEEPVPGFLSFSDLPDHSCDTNFEAPLRIVAEAVPLTIEPNAEDGGPTTRVLRIRRGSEIEEKVIETKGRAQALPSGLAADMDFVLCTSPFLGPFTKFGGGSLRLRVSGTEDGIERPISDVPNFQFSGFEPEDLLRNGLVAAQPDRIARIRFQLPRGSWAEKVSAANTALRGSVLKVSLRLAPLASSTAADTN